MSINGPSLYQWPLFLQLYMYLQLSHFCNDSQHSRLCHLFMFVTCKWDKAVKSFTQGLLVNLTVSERNKTNRKMFAVRSLLFKIRHKVGFCLLFFFFFPLLPTSVFIYFEICSAGILFETVVLYGGDPIKIFRVENLFVCWTSTRAHIGTILIRVDLLEVHLTPESIVFIFRRRNNVCDLHDMKLKRRGMHLLLEKKN